MGMSGDAGALAIHCSSLVMVHPPRRVVEGHYRISMPCMLLLMASHNFETLGESRYK